ncbi:MAG: heavy-metal-associated domain-containing protein [Oscillospiraceae bacterium]|nr:heavy-metal-associated domain-containing protein [Oscillospiraceae bacterium]
MNITKTYFLENLCCENCAAAIKREVCALAGVQNAELDYPNTSIAVTFDADADEIFRSVSAIASEIDEDIVTRES